MPELRRRGPLRGFAAVPRGARRLAGDMHALGAFGGAQRRGALVNPAALERLRRDVSRLANESRTVASMRARAELAAEELADRALWQEYEGRGFRQQVEEHEIHERMSRREQAEEAKKLAKLEAEIRKRLLAGGKISPRLAGIVSKEIAIALRENLGNEKVNSSQLGALVRRTGELILGELRSQNLRQAMARNRQIFPRLIKEASEMAMKEQGLIQEAAGE